jgi:predicted Fe-Mo cluster-binding NifX family protein
MRLAIAYENGEVCQHFGQTPSYLLVDIENGKVVNETIHDNGGASHAELVNVLTSLNVNAIICGGIGSMAFTLLTLAEIKVYASCLGSAEQAKNDFLAGKLSIAKTATHECSCHH